MCILILCLSFNLSKMIEILIMNLFLVKDNVIENMKNNCVYNLWFFII